MDDDPTTTVRSHHISLNTSPLSLEDLHPAIREACVSLFANGHYSDGVHQAAIALADLVRERGGAELRTLDGSDLMTKAFRLEGTRIVVADLGTPTGKSIQLGTMFLAQGAIMALRNPVAHGRLDLELAEAMEMVATLSLVARRVQQAIRPPFEATVEFMDRIASELKLHRRQVTSGWVYAVTPGGHGVGVFKTKPDVHFNLELLRKGGSAQTADEIVRRIGELTGRAAAPSWPVIGCADFMAGAQRVRETVIKPYVQALRKLEIERKLASRHPSGPRPTFFLL